MKAYQLLVKYRAWTEFFGKGQLFDGRLSVSTLGRCGGVRIDQTGRKQFTINLQ